MKQKLLTIVIPVYKVEPYIIKCLDSVVVAPELMEKIDVLIINDGTPDRSAEMSREYEKRFPGVFRQIDKGNGGHGSVWTLGLKEAYGKYTRFLDSDDWLENLDKLVASIENCDADLVMTHTLCHCPGDELWKQEVKDMEFGHVYDADTFDWLGNHSHNNIIFHHSCTYKTEMFRQYLPLFLEKQPYDDVILGAAPIIGAKTLVAFDIVLYHYLMDRAGQSISMEVQRRNIDASIAVHKQVIEFVEAHPISEHSSKFAYFQSKLPKMYNSMYKGLSEFPYEERKTIHKEWDEWVRKRNPKLRTLWIRLYRWLPYRVFDWVEKAMKIKFKNLVIN